MCTSILPGPKEQNPNKIQWFLYPIVSNLICLWKDGITCPTESMLCSEFLLFCTVNYVLTETGCLIHVILMAIVCNKPAAHKISGFASHSHTNFCTLCWISIYEKDKLVAFWVGGESCIYHFLVLSHSLQHSALGQMKSNINLVKITVNSPHPLHARTSLRNMQPIICSYPVSLTSTWLNRLWLT